MSTLAPQPLQSPSEPAPFSFGGYISQPGAIEGVGFWPRFAARCIDLAVHYVVTFFVGAVCGVVLVIASHSTSVPFRILLAKLSGSKALTIFFSLLGYFSYYVIGESFHGGTVGKLALSMVVVQEDGSPCRFGSAVIRSFAYYVDALFFGLIGYFEMQKTVQMQRFGDHWAHTVVCKRSAVPPQYLRSAERYAVGLFLAILADAILVSIGQALKFL